MQRGRLESIKAPRSKLTEPIFREHTRLKPVVHRGLSGVSIASVSEWGYVVNGMLSPVTRNTPDNRNSFHTVPLLLDTGSVIAWETQIVLTTQKALASQKSGAANILSTIPSRRRLPRS